GAAPMGALMVMLDLGHLLKVYQHIEFSATGIIHILNGDEHEELECRPEGLVFNPNERRSTALADQLHKRRSLTTDLFQDGQSYVSSFRRAERFSFVLVVSRTMDDIRAPHRKVWLHSLSTLGILTLIIIAGTYFIASGIGRQGALFGALVASNEKNRSL